MANDGLLRGTLDLLVLQVVSDGPLHGYAISRRIRAGSDDVLEVEEGSLYPALHRLERRGMIRGLWGESEAGRKARFYRLTRAGQRELERERASWQRLSGAVGRLLGMAPGGDS